MNEVFNLTYQNNAQLEMDIEKTYIKRIFNIYKKHNENPLDIYGKYIEDNNMILDQLIVEIVKPIKLTSKKVSVTANVKAIQYRGQSIQTGGKSIFYLNKDSLSAKLLPGDILEFKNIQLIFLISTVSIFLLLDFMILIII